MKESLQRTNIQHNASIIHPYSLVSRGKKFCGKLSAKISIKRCQPYSLGSPHGFEEKSDFHL